MNIRIKNLAFLGLVAMCLFAMPAFSMPAGNGASNGPCNVSDKNCNAWAGGMGHPEMGMMAGPCMAMQKMGPGEFGNYKNASWNETRTIEVHQSGNGFAISDTQNKILKMSIEGQINPDSVDIKSLISENKTIAQIKSDIKAKMDAEIAAASYNGSLRLGESNYNLAKIKVTPSKDNSTTIEADVIGPKANANDKPTTTAGHLTVTTTRQDNSTIGEGTLTMNAGGTYKVLLDMGHARGEFNRMCAFGFGGMNKNQERFGQNRMMNVPMPGIAPKA